MSYKFSSYLKPIVIWAGVFSITVGLLVILGWILDIPVLKSLNPEYISMKANTALCFIMSGIAVVLLYESNRSEWLKILAKCLLGFVMLISSINLLEYILGWNAGIDEFLFREGQGTAATMYPGRMALNTIVCFFLLCIALLITDNKNKWTANLSQLLAISASILCVLPQLGYAYNESELFTFAYKTPMALYTAITFLALSFGIFFIRPDAGLLNLLGSEGMGGIFARRIFPVLIILPIIFIWIRLAVQVGGYQFKTIDLSIISIIYISLFIVVYWQTFKELNNLDIERKISEKQLLLARDVLGLLNKIEDSDLMITKVIKKIKERTGIEAVAIRLKKGDDYPYFAQPDLVRNL